jgi:outer membrane protein W
MPRGGCAGAALAATAAWWCAALCCPGAARAQAAAATAPARPADARVEFDIPSQPMAAALNAWAVQANTQVFVDPGHVAHLTAPAIKGSLTPRQALRALLARSHLQVSQGANGVFVIKPRPTAVAGQKPPAPPSAAPEAPTTPATVAREPLTARASEGPWLLGVSADYAQDNGNASGGATAAVSGEYFITDHVAAALGLTAPRTHSIEVPGTAAAAAHRASARLQSSAVTFKYYFAPEDRWDPYLGAGVDVTALYAARGVAGLDRVTAGPTAEAGVNLRLDRHWMLNAAASWAQVQPAAGAMPSRDIRINPLQFDLGFVYRF